MIHYYQISLPSTQKGLSMDALGMLAAFAAITFLCSIYAAKSLQKIPDRALRFHRKH